MWKNLKKLRMRPLVMEAEEKTAARKRLQKVMKEAEKRRRTKKKK